MNDLWEDRDIVPNPLASDSGVYAKKKQLDQVNSEIALLEKRLAESLDQRGPYIFFLVGDTVCIEETSILSERRVH